MKLRDFGSTGMRVSETGFGAWGIGGAAYGAVDKDESLRALAKAEEFGCNFVDTAMVYGDSELVLGEFLRGRRERWLLSTKFSGQDEGLEHTLETQLQRLGTDRVDFYQIHWAPDASEQDLYEALYRIKKAGKARAVGVSLKTARDIDRVLDHTAIDGFMVRFSLLDPDPFMARLDRIRAKRPAIIVRSALKEGFLTGKFTRDASFPDPNDQRHEWTREQIITAVDAVEQFRFLEAETGTMAVAAARYPLSFPEVSTVILGTKTVAHAQSNFGAAPGQGLSAHNLSRVAELQNRLGLRPWKQRVLEALRSVLGRS